jgi:sortase (surface protein transpeptidase)
VNLLVIAAATLVVSGAKAPPVLPVGAKVGTIAVPSIGMRATFVEGSMEMYNGEKVYLPELTNGPAHYPANALPWQKGTVAIAGHRVSNTRPFFNLGKVRLGNVIWIRTRWGAYRYRVMPPPEGHAYVRKGPATATAPCAKRNACGIVWRGAGWFLRPSYNGRTDLVLSTCTPKSSSDWRIVVFAKRI